MATPHHVGPVPIQQFANAAERLRTLLQSRSVTPPSGSCLEAILQECERFSQEARTVTPPGTGAAQDNLAVSLGAKQIMTFRLAESLEELDRRRSPELTEKLRDLAGKQQGNTEHEEQFAAAEYETFCASDFSKHGFRIAFISSRQVSTATTTRVEFLVNHKWPVECKKPRSDDRVLANVRAAVAKINERYEARGHEGLVCISLDDALNVGQQPFCEVENTEGLVILASTALRTFMDKRREEILNVLRGGHTRAAIFHFTCMCYEHGTGFVGLPTLRIGLSADGSWLQDKAILQCMTILDGRPGGDK